MDILNKLSENENLSLAFGYFDGFHAGHRAVIKSAVNFGDNKSAVVTFRNHPLSYLKKSSPNFIMQQETRISFFEKLGVDYLYLLDFDEKIANQTPQEFLGLIYKMFKPVSISTGFNYTFGINKSGNSKVLQENQEKYGYKYIELAPSTYNDEVISSSKIREKLTNGDIQGANKFLGYNFFIKGKVLKGDSIGRTIGYRTANIDYPTNLIDLPNGVYQVRVKIGTDEFDAIANYGSRPTVSNSDKKILEVHILNFSKDIYSQNLKVTFIKRIRDEKKFASLDELRIQIAEDIKCLE